MQEDDGELEPSSPPLLLLFFSLVGRMKEYERPTVPGDVLYDMVLHSQNDVDQNVVP